MGKEKIIPVDESTIEEDASQVASPESTLIDEESTESIEKTTPKSEHHSKHTVHETSSKSSEVKTEQKKHSEHTHHKPHTKNTPAHEYHGKHPVLVGLYDKHYKALMIFSMLLLLFSIGVIGYKFATTGDIVEKGVTLKGGVQVTAATKGLITDFNPDDLQSELRAEFPKADISVRATTDLGVPSGFVIEASDITQEELMTALYTKYPQIPQNQFSPENMSPSFGNSFFTQTLKAVFIAFLFMSLVVFIYFGEGAKWKWIATIISIIAGFVMFYGSNMIYYSIAILALIGLLILYFRVSIPSFAIILCAFSDILFSLAIFNLSGMKLNIGGVAAFLMLVGYSIDTDILMSVRVLKRREGTVFDRIMGSMKTGIMMSLAALIAALSAYFLSSSEIIKEIMFILVVGLAADIIFTWVQNAGILRWHLEKKGWK